MVGSDTAGTTRKHCATHQNGVDKRRLLPWRCWRSGEGFARLKVLPIGGAGVCCVILLLGWMSEGIGLVFGDQSVTAWAPPEIQDIVATIITAIGNVSTGLGLGANRAESPRYIERLLLQSFGSLTTRVCEPEVMDRPDLDAEEHHRALKGLARLNRVSNSVGIVWPAVLAAARRTQRPLRVLDLATGGGDVPLGLWCRACQFGLTLDILGVDVSSRAVEIARGRAHSAAQPFSSRPWMP